MYTYIVDYDETVCFLPFSILFCFCCCLQNSIHMYVYVRVVTRSHILLRIKYIICRYIEVHNFGYFFLIIIIGLTQINNHIINRYSDLVYVDLLFTF